MSILEHKLNVYSVTNFIENAIKIVCNDFNEIDASPGRMQHDAPCTTLHDLIRYTFYDVDIPKRDELYNQIKAAVLENKSDSDIYLIMYRWWNGLQDADRLGNPKITVDGRTMEYTKYKIYEITSTIGDDMPVMTNKLLVDVGAGDCSLTKNLANALNVAGVAIDIKQPIDWTSVATKEEDICAKLNQTKGENGINGSHIYYRGDNLVEAVKEAYPNSETGLIMYNHSLHHFGSYENIKDSLRQSYNLLSPGGVLFIREHDRAIVDNPSASNIYINLQHIFLQMRGYFKEGDINKTLIRLFDFVQLYTADFFSFDDIKGWCEGIGYTFKKKEMRKTNIVENGNDVPDVSHTMFLVFKKETGGQQPDSMDSASLGGKKRRRKTYKRVSRKRNKKTNKKRKHNKRK
jgi:hypothetical protein